VDNRVNAHRRRLSKAGKSGSAGREGGQRLASIIAALDQKTA